MRVRVTGAAACALVAAFAIGCGGVTDPSKNVTETFSGTIQPGKSDSARAFNVTTTGEFTVKVTALAPVSGLPIGVSLYQDPSSGACQNLGLYQQNAFASLNVQALSGQIFANHYCLIAYDSVGLTAATSYTLTVSHP